jgi:orotate phosphoribosyltransferase
MADERFLGIPHEAKAIVAAYNNTAHLGSVLKAHPNYEAAKSGDAIAALRLVSDLLPDKMLRAARRRWPGAVFLFGTAYTDWGINHLPAALAWRLSQVSGGEVAFLTQRSRGQRTGTSAARRMLCRPLFQGNIEANRRYVLVDDVVVLGGTLAEMANVVRQQGGNIAGIAVLVNASRANHLHSVKSQVNLLRLKYGNEVEKILSIKLEALTRQEAKYLAGFRHIDALRNRLVRAKNERGAGENA